MDPTKVKKEGAGSFNWWVKSVHPLNTYCMLQFVRGRDGEEVQDYGYNLTNPRRRSNSSNLVLGDFKTKFEDVDQDPVFEEELHGPTQYGPRFHTL